jgi:hypothetical protein
VRAPNSANPTAPAGFEPTSPAARFAARDSIQVVRCYQRPPAATSGKLVTWCADRLAPFGSLHAWLVENARQIAGVAGGAAGAGNLARPRVADMVGDLHTAQVVKNGLVSDPRSTTTRTELRRARLWAAGG